MPDMYRHWKSTLSPLVTVCRSEGYISIVGISLGSTSRIELARPDPQDDVAVQTYIPLSLTDADVTVITDPATDRAGELRSSPTFSQDIAEDPDPMQVSLVPDPCGIVCSLGSIVTVTVGQASCGLYLGWAGLGFLCLCSGIGYCGASSIFLSSGYCTGGR